MIVGISGKLISKNPPELVVEVNGIRYSIFVPVLDFDKMGSKGDKIFLHTQLFVKDELLEIYGFLSEEERKLFLNLIKVQGLGPRSALGILSQIEYNDLIQAIHGNDLDRISMLKGIGKKKASKILIELKGKFIPEKSQSFTDAYQALQILGLSAAEASRRLQGIDDGLPTEEIIKEALRRG